MPAIAAAWSPLSLRFSNACRFSGRSFYRVFVTESFERDFQKLPRDEQRRIEKAKEQLRSNPFVGKPLGYRFFREKKIGGNRLYYLIYESKVIVLIVAYSGKKEQQATINAIKAAFEQFKQEVDKFGWPSSTL